MRKIFYMSFCLLICNTSNAYENKVAYIRQIDAPSIKTGYYSNLHDTNTAEIYQVGNYEAAKINQSGAINHTMIYQDGNLNRAIINQGLGSYNNASVLQNGLQNSVLVTQQQYNNNAYVTQNGQGNDVQIYQSGLHGNVVVSQTGVIITNYTKCCHP